MPKRSRRVAARQAELSRKKKKKGHGPSAPEQQARKLATEEQALVLPRPQAPQSQAPGETAPGVTPPAAEAPPTARRPSPAHRLQGQARVPIPTSVRTDLKGDLLRITAVSGLIFLLLAVLTVVLR